MKQIHNKIRLFTLLLVCAGFFTILFFIIKPTILIAHAESGLQHSTVYGEWDDSYLHYNCYYATLPTRRENAKAYFGRAYLGQKIMK